MCSLGDERGVQGVAATAGRHLRTGEGRSPLGHPARPPRHPADARARQGNEDRHGERGQEAARIAVRTECALIPRR